MTIRKHRDQPFEKHSTIGKNLSSMGIGSFQVIDRNRLHRGTLRVLLHDYESTFEELLRKSCEYTMHTRNLQKLMLEVYKCLTSGNPSFLWDFFKRKPVNDNLRIKDLVQLPDTRTLRYRNDSLAFRGRIL